MYQLYGGKYTRALIVQMVMAEGDLDYKVVEIDILKQEEKSDEFLAINPAGYVPALSCPDGQVLHETQAINLYLCEQHALHHLAPSPADPDRGLFLSRLFFLADDLEPVIKQFFYPHWFALRDEDVIPLKEKFLGTLLSRFQVIEQQLQNNGPYMLGDKFSLLDIILAYWVEYLNTPGVFYELPGLIQNLVLVSNRPKLQPFFDEHIRIRDEYLAKETK